MVAKAFEELEKFGCLTNISSLQGLFFKEIIRNNVQNNPYLEKLIPYIICGVFSGKRKGIPANVCIESLFTSGKIDIYLNKLSKAKDDSSTLEQIGLDISNDIEKFFENNFKPNQPSVIG